MHTDTMTPGEWAADARQARHEAALPPLCIRCGDEDARHSARLDAALCSQCYDAFRAWDRRNPHAPYDDFLEAAPVLVGADAGQALVGALLFMAALALVILGVIVGFTAPLFSGGHLIGAPVLIVGGGALAWHVLTPARADR